jgi:hypothetical protein
MGSHPSCDRSAIACAAGAVTAHEAASGPTAAGARWNHESVEVSSIFLIRSARDSTGTHLGSACWVGNHSVFGARRPINYRPDFNAFRS